jgi:hypothetical protein
MDKPLHVIYKVSKLAYRIIVILIANKRVKRKVCKFRIRCACNLSHSWVGGLSFDLYPSEL